MIYNTSMKLEHLLENEQATAIFDAVLPGMRQRVGGNAQSLQLSIEQLLRYAHLPQTEELLERLETALSALNTPENRISPRERELIEHFHAIAQAEQSRPRPEASHRQEAICPGQPWLDSKGEPIQAHGGAVYYEDGTYYWYGENKAYTDGQNGIWTWGLRVYASRDLLNWEDMGYLIPPVLDDPDATLFPSKRVDRPHILKCPASGKYVCWIKLSGPEAAFTIWQADRLLGPYEMVENLYNPGGHKVGDFDLISDPETGKGYLYFDADHSCLLCMELTEDYTHAERELSQSYANLRPPFTREAPALFAHQGKKYLLTSGMTGYVPNRSDSASSDSWEGPFTSLGDPHLDDASHASFNSQISKIFPIAGSDRFIAMADRWLPETVVDARLADVFTRVIAGSYDPEHYPSTQKERLEMYEANQLETANTSIATYVWLPIEWEDGRPVLRWQDTWTP